jgi:hypothetical protein
MKKVIDLKFDTLIEAEQTKLDLETKFSYKNITLNINKSGIRLFGEVDNEIVQ